MAKTSKTTNTRSPSKKKKKGINSTPEMMRVLTC